MNSLADRLHQAIDRNDVAQLIECLESGVDCNAIDTQGDTGLHRAVRHRRLEIAARLLAHGARWRMHNRAGLAALDLDHIDIQTLHGLRQHYHRLEIREYGNQQPGSERTRAWLQQLRSDGFVRVPGLLSGTLVDRIKSDFNRSIARLRLNRMLRRNKFRHYDQKEYWRRKHLAYVFNDALAGSSAVLELCCHPELAQAANQYLGRPAHIKRVHGLRYLPQRSMATNQFGWHHDMEDRLFKVMLLLNDVGENDQFMSYVCGSHRTFRPYENFLKNDLQFEHFVIDGRPTQIARTLGSTGDIFLFDPNGMHRGNRSLSRVRDALFIEYAVDENAGSFWGTELEASRIDAIVQGPDHPLARFRHLTPKWQRAALEPRRTRPTWAESLDDPDRWIRKQNVSA